MVSINRAREKLFVGKEECLFQAQNSLRGKNKKQYSKQEIYDVYHNGSPEEIRDLKSYLIQSNTRFIHRIANDHFKTFCQKYSDDLFQSGCEGILIALDKYIPAYEFNTLAKSYILHEMSNFVTGIKDLSSPHYGTIQKKVVNAQNYLRAQGVEVTVSQVAIMTGLAVDVVKESLDIINRTNFVYLDGAEYENSIFDSLIADPQKIVELQESKQAIYEDIQALSDPMRTIIILHFGFFGESCMSFAAIAKELDITITKVRNYYHKALILLNQSEHLRRFFTNRYENGIKDIDDYNVMKVPDSKIIDKQLEDLANFESDEEIVISFKKRGRVC